MPETHQGPHPEHGGLETHIGTRDNCSGPDCGPPDPEDEIRDAALDLDHPDTAVVYPGIGSLLGDLLHEIAEEVEAGALTSVQEAALRLARKISDRPSAAPKES